MYFMNQTLSKTPLRNHELVDVTIIAIVTTDMVVIGDEIHTDHTRSQLVNDQNSLILEN